MFDWERQRNNKSDKYDCKKELNGKKKEKKIYYVCLWLFPVDGGFRIYGGINAVN